MVAAGAAHRRIHPGRLRLLETVPGVGSQRPLRETTAMINEMRHQYPGLVIPPAHDPGAASRLAQATGQAPTLASA